MTRVPWPTLIALSVIALVALVLGTFQLVVFLAALFEKRSVRELIPASLDAPLSSNQKFRKAIDDALSMGFSDIGYFTEIDPGMVRGYVRLLLSPERDVIGWMQSGGGTRYKAISRLESTDRWIETSEVFGEADLSGQREEQMLAGPWPALLAYHRDRLREAGGTVAMFDPTTLIEDLKGREERRLERLLASGLVRWRNEAKRMWSYSLRGAFLIVRASLMQMSGMGQVNRITDQYSLSNKRP